jgi:hypothetical protein
MKMPFTCRFWMQEKRYQIYEKRVSFSKKPCRFWMQETQGSNLQEDAFACHKSLVEMEA